ncbi:3-carboxy-cis,cis-muconate cycloisomerase [Aureimonas flava]|uniref:3-carboxy-cis,cis-muconate cycloisomerase n=1 Tax=Aureimonas flava TaxID=2320271 RepID=A0A3A1WGZ0_9HYPH|nr:3-carboxy-cis,cis-muconate cycloisomerase [Aureimonas flava]RIX99666.1 3-carboxy-cis,cis-muconate cycloisomerase [Aureimonas flava]
MPLVEGLTGDREIRAHFAAEAEIAAMLRFEAALAEAQAALGIVPAEAAGAIRDVCAAPFGELDAVRAGMGRDGVPVPALVKALRERVGAPHGAHVHRGATSQDVVDTGLMLRMRAVLALLGGRVEALLARLDGMAEAQGGLDLMAWTRMQAALPFRAADKLATWRRPLEAHRARLAALAADLPVQLGGPVGNGDGFGPLYPALRADLARRLALRDSPPWHADRTAVLDIAHALALLTGTLGKIGQDVALMAQTGMAAIELSGGGGSSAMAHKKNPVGAEALVSLARFDAGLLGILSQSMVHENERSGAAWTLEWLVLPQMAEAAGAACRLAEALLAGARFVARPPAG